MMIHVPGGADFCDDQLPILSTIGRGPVGPKGPKGDKGDTVEPTFADPLEWNNNRSYAAYTIVLHDGDSYTSKVDVPIGISLDNGYYWVHTGNYNAQVEAYRNEVLRYAEQVDTFDARIEQANNRVGQERTARENADSQLSNRISQEQSARGSADTQLGNNITSNTQDIDDLEANKVPYPLPPASKYGNATQVLSSLGDGRTEWINQYAPTDAQASAAITAWLNAHPEATTTVQDDSITPAKLTGPTNDRLFGDVFSAGDGAEPPTIKYSEHSNTFIVSGITAIYEINHESSGDGFKYYGQATHTFSVPSGSVLVWNSNTGVASVKTAGAILDAYDIPLLWNHRGHAKGEWAWLYYSRLPFAGAIMPASSYSEYPTFSYDSTNRILSVSNIAAIYTQSVDASGDAFTWYGQNTATYSIPDNNALVWSNMTHTLSVKATNSILGYYEIPLLWNHHGNMKGVWAWMYYNDKIVKTMDTPIVPNMKIMSRQGEGYSYPDNSIEGLSAALKNGYRNIRVSAAHTSDGVWYATHSYEMQNNSTQHVLTYKYDGSQYEPNLNINDTLSSVIEDLNYKGYAIPTLESVLKLAARHNAKVTIELKDDVSSGSTTQNLVDLVTTYTPDAVFSGLSYQCANVCGETSRKLNVAVICHFSTSELSNAVSTFLTSGLAKSLRLDCFYADTITFYDILAIHEAGATLKLGGSSVTAAQVAEYAEKIDIVECDISYRKFATTI